MQIKLSIVVPCYNAEEYLVTFFKCVNEQSLEKSQFEIIFVDDLSVDNTVNKIKKKIYEYKNMSCKIIQSNSKSGAGGARNIGLMHSKGEYIMFVDCDDTFDNVFFEKMLNKIASEKLDIVVCDYNIEKQKKHILQVSQSEIKYSERKCFQSPATWNKIFSKKYLNETGIIFQKNLKHQDLGTVIKWMYLTDKIGHIDEKLYTYKLDNANSITSKSRKFDKDIYEILDDLYHFFKEKDIYIYEQIMYRAFQERYQSYSQYSFFKSIKYMNYITQYIEKKKSYGETTITTTRYKKAYLIYLINKFSKGIGTTIIFKLVRVFK